MSELPAERGAEAVTDSPQTIPLVRMRVLLLVLAVGAVALQVFLLLRRGGDVVITGTIIGAIGLVAVVMALVLRTVAGRVEKLTHELRAQRSEKVVVVVVVHHPALRAWANKRDHVASIGSYPVVVVEDRGLRILGVDSDRGPLLEWSEVESVSVTTLAERFFVRRAIELRTATESVVLAPYGKRALVGFHAGTEAEFHSLWATLRASVIPGGPE